MTPSATLALAATAGTSRLVLAAVLAIAVIVLLITWARLHPFLSLTLGSLLVAWIGGIGLTDGVASFTKGVGATVASVGVLIALGAMFGRLLADSGGADQLVDTIVGRASPQALPWAMALVGALIGLPMFFEIGLVLLIPVVLLVARRAELPLMRVGLPALAGLSVMHGLVPPHPGPLVAVAALKADLGVTLGLGVLIAVPSVVLAGPLLSRWVARWVPVGVPDRLIAAIGGTSTRPIRRPGFGVTLATVLLPVVLMLGKAVVDIAGQAAQPVAAVFDLVGTPVVALLLAVLVALQTFGRGAGMDRARIAASLEASLPPIAGILLIVGAGGGFKQTLVDTGIGPVLADAIAGSRVSPLVLAWVVAVLIRLATGSATVATVTASGILAPLAATLSAAHTSLLALSIGAGSLFLSHVNDAGFWLVKEYFGLTVGETLRSWSVMESVISVIGLVLVLAVSLVV